MTKNTTRCVLSKGQARLFRRDDTIVDLGFA